MGGVLQNGVKGVVSFVGLPPLSSSLFVVFTLPVHGCAQLDGSVCGWERVRMGVVSLEWGRLHPLLFALTTTTHLNLNLNVMPSAADFKHLASLAASQRGEPPSSRRNQPAEEGSEEETGFGSEESSEDETDTPFAAQANSRRTGSTTIRLCAHRSESEGVRFPSHPCGGDFVSCFLSEPCRSVCVCCVLW